MYPARGGAWASGVKSSSDNSKVQTRLQTLHEGKGTKVQHLERSWPRGQCEDPEGKHEYGKEDSLRAELSRSWVPSPASPLPRAYPRLKGPSQG